MAKRTEQEIFDLLDHHLDYEITMLRCCYHWVLHGQDTAFQECLSRLKDAGDGREFFVANMAIE